VCDLHFVKPMNSGFQAMTFSLPVFSEHRIPIA
jgi:hypothetical protein